MREENSESEEGAFDLAAKFTKRFADYPRIYQAPGRVNLIGEHTDYNDGFVLPAAVDFFTNVAIAPRADRKLLVFSGNYGEAAEFDLDRLPAVRIGRWSDYVSGVALALARSGEILSGANLWVEGNVPLGSGLSSSASMEVCVGYALIDLARDQVSIERYPLEIDRTSLSVLCQQAENTFVGARCGIMDQFVVSYGKIGKALLLDCRSLNFRDLPLPQETALLVCNTMVKHNIAAGEYNLRRKECEVGVRMLAAHQPTARALRDFTIGDWMAHGDELPELVRRRCRHVISENLRVLQAAAALEAVDLLTFGDLMRESHRSLRDDFEVSCPELNLMVELAAPIEGVYGTRMMGGGFGGCTISLVAEACVDDFQRTVSAGYERSTNCRPEIYVCSTAPGVRRLS